MPSFRSRNGLEKECKNESGGKRLQFIKKRHRELILKLRYDPGEPGITDVDGGLGDPIDKDRCNVMRDLRRRGRGAK